MKIIESLIEGKIDQTNCEDALFINDDFIAVIDGVTSKVNYKLDGKTTGKLASLLILRTFENIESEVDVNGFLEKVNYNFNKFYSENKFPFDKYKYGPQAVAAIYSKKRKEVWLIGDTQALVNNKYYNFPKKSDIILSEFRSLIYNIDVKKNEIPKEQYFQSSDPSREAIIPYIADSTIFANDGVSSFGYAVINGEEIPKTLIKIIKVEDDDEIVLASDGYPILEDTLERSEKQLKRIIEEDKYCVDIFKSTKGLRKGQKSFDDRTYVRFSV